MVDDDGVPRILVSLCKVQGFFLLDRLSLRFQRKPASASLHKSHLGAFILKASAEQDQTRFEISFNSGSPAKNPSVAPDS